MSTKQRLSASVDAELVAVAQEAVAGGQAESVSAWVNEALRLKAEQERSWYGAGRMCGTLVRRATARESPDARLGRRGVCRG